jgi:hypothetical protein
MLATANLLMCVAGGRCARLRGGVDPKYFPDLGPGGGYPYDFTVTTPLPDGRYEVIVLDVADDLTADGPAGSRQVEVTILEGDHKGEVVALVAQGLAGDPMDLLAAPGVLTVTEGVPRLSLDD